VEQIAETLSLPLTQVTEIANRSAEQWTLRSKQQHAIESSIRWSSGSIALPSC
jgi:hypothetical protein